MQKGAISSNRVAFDDCAALSSEPGQADRRLERERAQSIREGWCPSKTQLLLLKAALLDGNAAIDAWHRWSRSVDIETLDDGSNRLLPLLSYNLEGLGLRAADSGRFRGYRRKTWFGNQIRMKALESIVENFRRIGLDAIVLKGIPLAFLSYPDPSTRPLWDIDILVHRDAALRALALMVERGWSATDPRVARRLDRFFRVEDARKAVPDPELQMRILQRESIALTDQSGMEVDLHWNVFHYRAWPGADDDLWSGAVDATVGNLRTRILCPSDSLLHVLEHGSRWNKVPPIRWVADAIMIMRANPAIDWERLVRLARMHQLTFGIHRMLDLLRWEFDAPIPSEVLTELGACRTNWVERAEHRLTNHSPGEPPMLWRLWFSHLRWNRDASLTDIFLTFPRHLQYAFDLRRMYELPGFAVSRITFKCWRAMFQRASQSQGEEAAG